MASALHRHESRGNVRPGASSRGRAPTLSRFRCRGLRVVHGIQQSKLTAIALSVRAGARFDGKHPGLAHFAEHMLFQGTARLDQATLNCRAAELGGEHNADTGYEDISLTFEVFNEDLPAALELLAGQFFDTRVDEAGLRKERRVVMEEIRGHLDDPAERVHRRAWNRFFAGAIAHPICGSLTSVRHIDIEAVKEFLRVYFTADNSSLAVVGGASLAETRAAVGKHFSRRRPSVARRFPRVLPGRSGVLRVRDGGTGQTHVSRFMSVSPLPRRVLASGMALDMIGGDPDSRLYQELRERLGLTYDVGAVLEWGPDWAVAVVSASGARAQTRRLWGAIEDTLRRAAETGFGDDELRRARKKIRYRYALLTDNRLDAALALAESALWGFPAPEEAEGVIDTLTRGEIEQEWRRIFAARSLTAVLS